MTIMHTAVVQAFGKPIGSAAVTPLTAGSIMSRDVAAVTADSSLPAAIRLMLERRVSGLPVLDGVGTLAGVLTEGDLLRRVELGTEAHRTGWMQFILGPRRQAEDYVEANSRVVGDVMTMPALTVEVTAPLADVVALMQDKHIKRVPVMSGHTLVGVVSRSDLLRALAGTFVEGPAGAPNDETIREGVLSALHGQSWAPQGGVSVTVTGGAVDLDGVIFEEGNRAAIRVAAQNVAGVTAVRDHLTWVDSYSGMSYSPDEAPQLPPGTL